MKTCTKCGQNIPDNAKFCSFCGEVAEGVKATQENTAQESTTYYAVPEAQAPAGNREEEQKNLDSLSNRLKWERLAWKVQGIIFLVFAIFFILVGSIAGIFGSALMVDGIENADNSYYEYYDENGDYYHGYDGDVGTDVGIMVAGGAGLYIALEYGIIGAVFLPIAIVNLVMAKKVGKYREKLYTDCTDAVNHATSVGSIVLGALFNEYALIAIIINFILTKKNKAVFDRIKANQSAYNNGQQ